MSKKEKAKKQPSRAGKIIKTTISAIICLILVVVMVAVNTILPGYERMVDSMLGGFNIRVDNSADTSDLDLQYNKCDYTADTIGEAETALSNQIAEEGVVLLENQDVLPGSADTKFSLFSVNSATATATDSMLGGRNLQQLFEEAGVSLNATLFDFYSKKSEDGYGLGSGSISYGDAEDFSINEVPLSELEAESGLLDSVKDTTPVYWMKRVAGEGRDMPRSMYNHTDIEEDKGKSYLEPDSVELELLQYLNDNYDEVILVVNSNAALELGWLENYPSIKAVVLAPAGIEALPGILTGAVNPSGRTVDTFAADASASPAAQNFGDYQYSDGSGELTKYNYVSYAEGIYVGYKYYETRYEDALLKQGNAGDFDYDAEVVYPFGHGLSYTTFAWSDMKTEWSDKTCTVTVDVTNTGDAAGKDVVELYVQSPYTDYDKENKVEKSAVQLVGYAKTGEIAPGEKETVTITFSEEQLKAYDYTNAKTFILDAGDYYITAAKDAHAAVNNVLTAKGTDMGGDTAMVEVYTPENKDVDVTTYAVDSYSGVEITNRLSEAAGDITYLSRSDWTGTFPVHDGEPSSQVSTWGNEINGDDGVSYTYTKTADADLIAKLDSFDSGNPDVEAASADIVYGKDNGLVLSQMRGLDYDDPLWDDLLDQLTADDYYNTVALSGYGVEAIDSVNKPFTIDADTANGLIYGGTGKYFPNSMTLAQTWNQPLAREFGTMLGNEALIGGCNGWYAPSMNIHRTPYSGRNGEYYSEDAFLSGAVGSNASYGAASKGMYTYIKHFAFNDQENHRGDRPGQYSIATWLNEQAAREIYLLPFEMCMKSGDVELNYIEKNGDSYENATTTVRASQAVMTSFNRVGATWAGGSYNLITGILRNEWGFNGFVLTDNANTGEFMDGQQMTEAGADAKLTYEADSARYDFDENDESDYYYARQAMHHILYTVANSNAMNGAMPGGTFSEGMRTCTKIQVAVNIVCILLIAVLVFFTVRRFRKKKVPEVAIEPQEAKEE